MKTRNLLIFHALPLVYMLFPFVWYGIFGDDRYLKGELGVIENATVVFLFIGIGFCVASLRQVSRQRIGGYLRAWMVVILLGAVYFAGEEMSWGQHWFGWKSPEAFVELNDQHETNLHNINYMFDQVPRALLSLAILVGGIVMPLYRRFRHREIDESNRLYWQWPTIDCVTAGLLVILIRPILSLHDYEFINPGETKESLFALFIMLYSISIWLRLKQRSGAASAAPTEAPA